MISIRYVQKLVLLVLAITFLSQCKKSSHKLTEPIKPEFLPISGTTCRSPDSDPGVTTYAQGFDGLQGYIGFSTQPVPPGQSYGMGFYSSVWSLTNANLDEFQIGLPSNWIQPDNSGNTEPLCPVGTMARDNWSERGPTWDSVFQTIEGGLGYWARNRFRYGSPKFSINSTPQCYDYQVASPGWSFFGSTEPLPDDRLTIAQLSNRLLIPPDGLTFADRPEGSFLGYTWMSLPLTDAVGGAKSVGANNWTIFLNSKNFKGPAAFFIANAWTKVADVFDYETARGNGLDTKMGFMGGGAMEINTVPFFRQSSDGETYIKIPQLKFPLTKDGKTVLIQDVMYFSRSTLYDKVEQWKNGGEAVSGVFTDGIFRPKLESYKIDYHHQGKEILGLQAAVNTTTFGDHSWGLNWGQVERKGCFPQYFKKQGDHYKVISEKEAPEALKGKEFKRATLGSPYISHQVNAWATPGPATNQDAIAVLADKSTVHYRWYRFVDQPSLQAYNFSEDKKQRLQSLVEKIHKNWTIDQTYIPDPSSGELVAFDPALIVQPPPGKEIGYVPIVVRQGVP